MIDIQSFATGFVVALLAIVLVTTPLIDAFRKALRRAQGTLQQANEHIALLEKYVGDLLQITPERLPNGRFAKRQENNHG